MESVSSKQNMNFKLFLRQIGFIKATSYQAIDDQNDLALIDALIKDDVVKRDELNEMHRAYQACSFYDLSDYQLDQNIVCLMPEYIAKQCDAIILDRDNKQYIIAMANPLDARHLECLSSHFEQKIVPVLSRKEDIVRYIENFYPRETRIRQQAMRAASYIQKDMPIDVSQLHATSSNQTTILLLNNILNGGIERKASDIHLEADGSNLHIRYRIDGYLIENIIKAPRVADILCRRLRALANLDVTQFLLPQDGSFTYIFEGHSYNMRISIMRIHGGFSAVLRISDTKKESFKLTNLVEDEEARHAITSFLEKKEGMMIVSGPTGSGKTSTLYASLMNINTSTMKIISIEDPIEIPLRRINQMQINPEIGLDFADILRSVLRQDPDVIMIGEIRDEITATIALRAATTGHKMFTTLHTKDTVSSIERLLDLDVDSFMVGSALNLIISQRLVRRICQYCIQDYQLNDNDKALLEHAHIKASDIVNHSKIGAGCIYCNNSGYQGRIAAYETLTINEKLSRIIRLRKIKELHEEANKILQGKRLIDNVYGLVKKGKTTLKEALQLLD